MHNLSSTMGTSAGILLACIAVSSVVAAPASFKNTGCRCFPSDKCWPTPSVWSAFNQTVEGGLIATVPLGQPCHDPDFNAATCSSLQSQWTLPDIQ